MAGSGAEPEELQELLQPFPEEELVAYPASRRVNETNDEGPELVEPVGETLDAEGDEQPGLGL